MRSLSSLATEYIAYLVSCTAYDGTTVDPTGDTTKIAFMPPGQQPASEDWHAASWLATRVVGVLVGPRGGMVLTAGSYDVWINLIDDTEEPVEPVEVLMIT